MNINFISQIPQEKEITSATNLFVFNPEHDFALAVGKGSYTPPAEIVNVRKKYSLLPASYADNGDFIFVSDSLSASDLKSSPFFKEVNKKDITIVDKDSLPVYSRIITKVIPWGWDFAIFNNLMEAGLEPKLLPSAEQLLEIRTLSHRRTTIPFLQTLSNLLNLQDFQFPVEIANIEMLDSYLSAAHPFYLKAPWSSSGRGIILSDHITLQGLLEWSHGIIRRQGSILLEKAWNKKIDFATEWWITEGEPIFLGVSVFKTSSRGKYHGNIIASQEELFKLISKEAPGFNEDLIEAQKYSLRHHIGTRYSGPVGIDMLADYKGNINPCVELNMRLTMGMIPLIQNRGFLFNFGV